MKTIYEVEDFLKELGLFYRRDFLKPYEKEAGEKSSERETFAKTVHVLRLFTGVLWLFDKDELFLGITYDDDGRSIAITPANSEELA